MATSAEIICGICYARHTNKAADHWCLECDEGLCSECQESYHGVSKGSRNHDVVDIANYKKLPSSVMKITNHCAEHNRKYQLYCPQHDTLCCLVCLSSNHKKCTDLMDVTELTKTSKSSTLLESMEQSLQNLKNNLQNIAKDRQQNLAKLREERLKINTEIKRIRDKINSHLDTLEQKILTELHTAEKESTQKIEKLLEKMTTKTKKVDELESAILALKQHATDMQTFFGSKEINKEIESEEKNMKLLFEDCSLEQLTLKCNIDDKISDIMSSITSFASVTIKSDPPSVSLKVGKGKQAQIMSIIRQPSLKNIQEIKPILVSTFTIPTAIRGCIVRQNGQMMFAQYASLNIKLILMNGDGTTDKEIPISSSSTDVTMMDDQTVAVATDGGICIINIGTGQTQRLIKTSTPCDGITYHNDTLLWCEQGKGLQMLHLSDNNITTLVQQNGLPDSCYVAACENKIYQTNYRNKSVICFSTKGEQIWEYRDESFKNGPIGITVDKNYNIYITTYDTHSVVVLTPDGKQSRKLLCKSDGLKYPWGIHFDKTNNNMFVTNYADGKAFLYKIS